MSALVERIISARDGLKAMMGYASADDYASLGIAREVMAQAANGLAERDSRVKELETWWYAVPEDQRFGIMSDAAWKRHEAAGPK
jgi:hypothetical protein